MVEFMSRLRASRDGVGWKGRWWAVGSNDQNMVHAWMTMVYVIVGVMGTTGLLLLAWLPGARARARSHDSARLISIIGWCSLIVWPLWPVAMVWSTWHRRRGSGPTVRIRVSPARPKIAGSLPRTA